MSFGYGTGAAVAGKVARVTSGIPIEEGDTFFLFVRNRMSTPIPVVIVATFYNPRTDATATVSHAFTPTGTSYAQETSQSPNLPAGTVLTSVVIITQGAATKSALWAAAELFRQGQTVALLCADELNASSVPCWPKGSDGQPLANIMRDGALWQHQVTIVNDGATSGNHTYELAAASGGRLEIESFMIENLDAAARTVTINRLAATGGSTLEFLYGSAGVALNAAAGAIVPALGTAANAVGNLRAGDGKITVAGVQTILATIAAVAVSQDTRCSITARFWGPIPTLTATGPAGSTTTVNVNAVLAG